MSDTGKKMGRPTKYKPEMCEKVIELMKDGASHYEVGAALGVDQVTIHAWKKTNPDFAKAMKTGLDFSHGWWDKLGRDGASGEKNINPATWIFNMKNRFGWRDKTETEHTGSMCVKTIELVDEPKPDTTEDDEPNK